MVIEFWPRVPLVSSEAEPTPKEPVAYPARGQALKLLKGNTSAPWR